MKLVQWLGFGIVVSVIGCTSVNSPVGERKGPSENVTVFYQSNRFGSYEPCGCHTTPFGGLDRETNLIAEEKQKSGTVLYFDSGNMLVPPELKAAVEVYQSRAEVISEMLDKTGLNVFSPGATDLKLGLSFLQSLAKKTSFSFISSNLQDEKGVLAFSPYQIIKAGKISIGVLAVSPSSLKGKDFKVRPWKEALAQYLPEVQSKSEVVVVLSQLSANDADVLAKEFPQIALLVGGDEKLSLDSPHSVNAGKTLIVDAGINGFSVGRLQWEINTPFTGTFSEKEITDNRNKLAFYQEKLKTDPQNTTIQNEIKYLSEIAPTQEVAGGSLYAHEIMKLTAERYGKANEVTILMKNSKEKLKQFLLARSKKRKK